MKTKYWKRMLAIMLCTILMFGASISVWAENDLTEYEDATDFVKTSPEMELEQTVKNSEKELECKVIAYIPEGAFEADEEQISIEVSKVETSTENKIIKTLEEKLEDNKVVSSSAFYSLSFQVDGVETNPKEKIQIIFQDGKIQAKEENIQVCSYSDDGKLRKISSDETKSNNSTAKVTITKNDILKEIELATYKSGIYGYYIEDTETEPVAEEPSVLSISKDASTSAVAPVNNLATTSLGEPIHNKTIKANEDGSYTLSLDVIGKVGEGVPIDILLIVDKSGSMNTTRVNNVNTAIRTLVQTLKDSDIDESNVKLGVVEFAADTNLAVGKNDNSSQNTKGDAAIKKTWQSLNTINRAQIGTSFYALSNTGGGTNWQAGIRMGEKLWASSVSGSKKYVLFLTDGDPTFRIGSIENENTLSGKTLGTGSSDPNDNNYNAAVSEWNNSLILSQTSTTKYVIDANPNGANKCDELANAIGAIELAGDNATNMATSFKTIASNIIKPTYTDVVIQDTLSEHVDFAFDTETHTSISGKIFHPEIGVYATKNGVKEKLTEYTDYTIQKMDYANKTIAVSIKNGNQLEDGVTYNVEFDIIPSEKASVDYMNIRYSNVLGDANTDAQGNTTSSGKEGFYSNGEAILFFAENKGESQDVAYAKPVVQIESISKTAKKEWVGAKNEYAEFTLTPYVEFEIGVKTYLGYLTLPNMLVNGKNEWTCTWNDLPKYHYYIDATTHRDARLEIQYQVGEIEVEGYDAEIPENQTNSQTTIIVNRERNIPDETFIRVQKTFDGIEKQDIPKDFEINLYQDSQGEYLLATLLLYYNEEKPLGILPEKSEDGYTFTWEIKALSTGTYYIKETNQLVEYYSNTINVKGNEIRIGGNGEIEVQTQSPEYTLAQTEQVNPNSSIEYSYAKHNLIVGSLTANAGFFVWTVESLSASEREKIVELIAMDANLKAEFDKITVEKTQFFSTIDTIEKGIDSRGLIQIQEGTLLFSHQNQWKKIGFAKYDKKEGINAEIEIINQYVENPIKIDLKKYGSSYEGSQLSGAIFSLYQEKSVNGEKQWIAIEEYKDFEVSTEKIELELLAGTYKLEERNAPVGFVRLSKDIYFTVFEQQVQLVDYDELAEENMWRLLSESEEIETIEIKNLSLYELPSTGGVGIFWSYIGGVMLMMAASLILYKDKGLKKM